MKNEMKVFEQQKIKEENNLKESKDTIVSNFAEIIDKLNHSIKYWKKK